MEKKTKLAIFLTLTIILIIVGWIFFSYFSEGLTFRVAGTSIRFNVDKNARTLTVKAICPEGEEHYTDCDIEWEDIGIRTGNATLPSGSVDVGDVITNCSGELLLAYEPSNQLIGWWDFT